MFVTGYPAGTLQYRLLPQEQGGGPLPSDAETAGHHRAGPGSLS